MNRKDAKDAKDVSRERLKLVASVVVESAIRVHKRLGPGLLESVYQRCMEYELQKAGLEVKCEVAQPIVYGGAPIDGGYRIDMIGEDLVIIENETVDRLLRIHAAQLLTYLKLSGLKLGFLLNWNVHLMKDGIQRFVNNL